MFRTQRGWRKNKAFSLVEMMLTVSVFAIVSMSVIGVMDASLRETYRLTAANDPFRDVQVYVEQMRTMPLSGYAELDGSIELLDKNGQLQSIPLKRWTKMVQAKGEVPVKIYIDIKYFPERGGKPPTTKGDPPNVDGIPGIEIIVHYKWKPEISSERVDVSEKKASIRVFRSYVVRY